MDRREVPIDDHAAPLVERSSVSHVPVAVSDDVCLRELVELLRALPKEHLENSARLVREMRDEERF